MFTNNKAGGNIFEESMNLFTVLQELIVNVGYSYIL